MGEPDHLFSHHHYIVEERPIISKSAKIYFVCHEATSMRVVLKILSKSEDEYRHQMSLKWRRECQIKALRWNPIFTSGIYLGLAPILHQTDEHIYLGEVLSDHEEVRRIPVPYKDYALVMRRLPPERQLDRLLKPYEDRSIDASAQEMMSIPFKSSEHGPEVPRALINLLAKRIATMHGQLPPLEDCARWGNFVRVQDKLKHNIALFEHEKVQSHLASPLYEELSSVLHRLAALSTESVYHEYFEERVRRKMIKRCHGDLKCMNIWIMPYEHAEPEDQYRYVKLLDAIDFNEVFSNIDPLSDIAMLAISIFVETRNRKLLHALIESYLALAQEQNEVARAVLAFYLFEKAIVVAAVSVLLDEMPQRGKLLLEVAKYVLEDSLKTHIQNHLLRFPAV